MLETTGCSYSGVGNGGLEAGKTYFFKVRAGNEFGYGPLSNLVEVAMPQVNFLQTTPAGGAASVPATDAITVVADQPVKITDADRIQVYEKRTGNPILKNQVIADGATVTINAPLRGNTEYQVAFYEQALENASSPQIYNRFTGWSFTTYGGSGDHGGNGSGGGASSTTADKTNDKTDAFTDTKGHCAGKEIEEMAAKGFIKGVGNGQFAPDSPITRAEFTTLLARCLELGKGDSISFKDVPRDAWFCDCVEKAYAAGIVKGLNENTFNPDGLIHREEMAAMIFSALTLTQACFCRFTRRLPVPSWITVTFATEQGRSAPSTWTRATTATLFMGLSRRTGIYRAP